MAYLNQTEITKLANAVAVDLVDGDIPLNTSISKLASQMDMNQEQIRRLCEATNNVTFSKAFAKKAGADDRLVDFPLADPRIILGEQIKSASVDAEQCTTSITSLLRLDDDMHAVRDKTAAQDEKVRVRVVGDKGDLKIFAVNKGYWEMPKGTTQKGENRRVAAARVLEESTGMRVMAMNLDYKGLEYFKGSTYHTFTVPSEKLRRIRMAQGKDGIRPRIEYRTKKADAEDVFELRPQNKVAHEVDVRVLEKTRDVLKQEKTAAELDYDDAVTELRGRFRQLYDVLPFETFEKQAAAYFGEASVAPLGFVRQMMNKPEVDYDFDVLQKHAGYVDTSTPEMALLQQAIDAHASVRKHAAAISLIEGQTR